jgi:hypothetical protein
MSGLYAIALMIVELEPEDLLLHKIGVSLVYLGLALLVPSAVYLFLWLRRSCPDRVIARGDPSFPPPSRHEIDPGTGLQIQERGPVSILKHACLSRILNERVLSVALLFIRHHAFFARPF